MAAIVAYALALFFICYVLLSTYELEFSATVRPRRESVLRAIGFRLQRVDEIKDPRDVTNEKQGGSSKPQTRAAGADVNSVTAEHVEKPSGDIFDACRLVDHPPWDDELRQLLNVDYDPLQNCTRGFRPLTQLIEGVLDTTFAAAMEGKYECEGRCLHPDTDYKYAETKWQELPVMALCDIAETRCTLKGSTKVVYNYLHSQIIPVWRQASTKKSRTSPNVFIVLFDSVADTQAMRSFPFTIAYLQERFGATRFRHLNKVGDNSRPNGYAFLLGEIAYGVNKEIFGVPSLKSRWGYDKSCKTPLNPQEDFVFSRFQRKGYRTMIAEDWGEGVFNYPKCVGFNQKPVDHYMRPFQLRLEESKSSLISRLMGTEACREPHQDIMEYFNKFLRAYPNDAKFGFIWMSHLTHDDPNKIFHADGYVKKFFERNADEFDDSFVFFMADHGLRFGDQRNTAAGRREVNNPMLHVIVPKEMRTRFQPILDRNSRELLTMFDLHATFVDIVEYQPRSNYSATNFIDIPAPTRGSSFLRELNPALPRNCRTLPIPFDYCPCEFTTAPLTDTEQRSAMAKFTLDLMNAELRQFNLSDSCATLQLSGDPNVIHYVDSPLYKVEFTATPGGGKFESMIRAAKPEEPSTYELASPFFNRLNAYGKAAECISRAPQKPFCYCKHLLSRTQGKSSND